VARVAGTRDNYAKTNVEWSRVGLQATVHGAKEQNHRLRNTVGTSYENKVVAGPAGSASGADYGAATKTPYDVHEQKRKSKAERELKPSRRHAKRLKKSASVLVGYTPRALCSQTHNPKNVPAGARRKAKQESAMQT